MDDFFVKLNILVDTLEKKHSCLTQILAISQNQETILLVPPTQEREAFFNETNAEKQRLIDDVLACDVAFERFFVAVKDKMEDKKEEGRVQITRLQALISQILELDVAVRAQEQKNGLLMKPGAPSARRAATPAFRAEVIDKISKHKK